MDPVTARAVGGDEMDVRPGCDSAGVELEVVMIGKLGLPEILIILAIALLIFGPGRLSELGKGLGEGIRNFKSAVKDGETPAEKK